VQNYFFVKESFLLKAQIMLFLDQCFFPILKYLNLKKCERVQVPKKEKFIVESKNVPNGETDEMI
jgi:hypothetical protein